MNIQQTNRYLLFTVIWGLIGVLFLSNFPLFQVSEIDIGSVSRYLVAVAVGIAILKKNRSSLKEYLPYHVPMKLSTALWIIVLALLVNPVMEVLAYVGGLLFGTSFETIAGLVPKDSAPLVRLINFALIPAVFEEVFYRGFFYRGYQKGRGTRTAILLTGILFGTFHMIAQQSFYALFAGFLLAALRELTGSMWPGMWLHFLNNGQSILYEQLEKWIPGAAKFNPENYYNFDTGTNRMIVIAACVASVPLIYLILRKIAAIEGKSEEFRTIFAEEKRSAPEKLWTPSLILSLCIEIGVMFFAGFLAEFVKQHPEYF